MDLPAGSRIQCIYRGYRGKVLKRARQLLHDDQAAEDATHDVFMRLLRADGRLLDDPEPLGWLYRVTTNLCLNRLRDERRRTKALGRYPAADVAPSNDVENRVIVAELMERIPAELQEIAIHYHCDGMTCAEIAALLCVSRRTIGNRLEAFQSEADAVVGNA